MATREDIRTFWRVEAPKQAVHYSFLLHELLALSALHKAYMEPGQRREFYALGSYHQDLAIKEMRKTLPNLGPNNAGAMFATGAVISITAFASTGLAAAHDANTRARSAIDDLLDIFSLQQGMYSILSQNQAHVQGGVFAVLLSDLANHEGEAIIPLMLSLAAQMPILTSFVESQPLAPSVRTELLSALSSFRSCLDFANEPGATTRPLRFLFFWPNHLNQEFCNLSRKKEPTALVILAYYAVVFRAAERFYWFVEGWAERITRSVADTVPAEPSWHTILQWPWDSVIGTLHGHSHQQEQPYSYGNHGHHENRTGTLQQTIA